MADHLMMPMTHVSVGSGFHGYRLGHHQQNPPCQTGCYGAGQRPLQYTPPGQLMASLHLQQLSTQHYGRPAGGPAPPLLSGRDADMVDEEVLGALVHELGLERMHQLPQLFLGHNEFELLVGRQLRH